MKRPHDILAKKRQKIIGKWRADIEARLDAIEQRLSPSSPAIKSRQQARIDEIMDGRI